MPHESLTPDQIAELTAPKKLGVFTRPEVDLVALKDPEKGKWLAQFRQAPSFSNLSGNYITWHDDHLQCLSRRCRAPTPYKVRGVALCGVHALIKLAELLDERDGYVNTNGFQNDWGDDINGSSSNY